MCNPKQNSSIYSSIHITPSKLYNSKHWSVLQFDLHIQLHQNFIMSTHISTKNKLAFSLGHVLNDICACIGVTYELVFFHKVLQLSNMYSGLLVLIGQVADGLSTMFVGIFSDRGYRRNQL